MTQEEKEAAIKKTWPHTTQRWFDGYLLLKLLYDEMQRTGSITVPADIQESMARMFDPGRYE